MSDAEWHGSSATNSRMKRMCAGILLVCVPYAILVNCSLRSGSRDIRSTSRAACIYSNEVPQRTSLGRTNPQGAHVVYARGLDDNRRTYSMPSRSGRSSPAADNHPAELIEKASRILGGQVVIVWESHNDWSSRRVWTIRTSRAEGIFMEKEGKYVHVNSGSELVAINEILSEYQMAQPDFVDARGFHFLHEVATLHDRSGLMFLATSALEGLGPLEFWLRGTEKDEAVLRALCREPEFVFEGNTWTVVFNMIRPDGAVDQWTVIGEHDPHADRSEIWKIDVTPLKPPGTFSYAMIG